MLLDATLVLLDHLVAMCTLCAGLQVLMELWGLEVRESKLAMALSENLRDKLLWLSRGRVSGKSRERNMIRFQVLRINR